MPPLRLLTGPKTVDEAGSLSLVVSPADPPPEACKLNVIIVPDVQKGPARGLSTTNWQWIHTILPNNTRVLVFQYKLVETPASVWQSIIDQAETLLNCIFNCELDVSRYPMVFICHGLGGLIVKRVLVDLHGIHSGPISHQLRAAQSGLVFLGSPHPTYKLKALWPRLNLLLRLTSGFSNLALAQAEHEAGIAANISLKFYELGLQVPVLSAYETKKTKVSGGWFKSRKQVLVDKSLGETSLVFEKLIPVECNHEDICDVLPGTMLHAELSALLRVASERVVSNEVSSVPAIAAIRIEDDRWQSEDSEAGHAVLGTTEFSSYDVIPNLEHFMLQKKKARLPSYLIDPEIRSPMFCSRDDILQELDEVLLPKNRTNQAVPGLQSFALWGLGGVGKTQVAIEFALTRKTHFDAVFWIEADEISKLAESFSQIALQLGLVTDAEATDRVVARNITLEWLSTSTKPLSKEGNEPILGSVEVNWLLVFDNADNPELLRDYWPMASQGSILLTSRDPMIQNSLYQTVGADLKPFLPEAAAALLRKLTRSDESTEEKESSVELSTRLGGLPLAITQIAALIQKRQESFREFRAYFDEATSIASLEQDLRKAKETNRQDHYKHSLFTVWAFDSLGEMSTRLLETLTLMNPDHIQEFILTEDLPPEVGRTFPATKELFGEARTDLLAASLVKRAHGELSLHRLVQDVVWAKMTLDGRAKAFSLAVQLLHPAWPQAQDTFSHDDMDLWKVQDQLVPHILRLLWAYLKLGVVSFGSEKISVKKSFAHLLQLGGWYLYERGNYKAAKPLFSAAQTICQEHAMEMPGLHSDILFCLATLGMDTNQPPKDVLALAKKSLDIRRSLSDTTPDDLFNLATAEAEYANASGYSGLFHQAIKHAENAKMMRKRHAEIINEDDMPIWANLHHARALLALGDEEKAAKILLDLLEWRTKHYGSKDLSYLRGVVYQTLGTVREKEKKFEASFEAYTSALENYLPTLGPTGYRTSQVILRLAEHHAREGHIETASVYFDKGIKGLEIHGFYSQDLAYTNFRIAFFREQQGDEVGAKEFLNRAKTFYEALGLQYEPDSFRLEDFERSIRHRNWV